MPPAAKGFWHYVDKSGPNDCWLWKGARNGDGYGCYSIPRENRQVRAHRHAYEQLVGSIPEGLVIDHLCRVRHCVNPDHLQPVTNRVNVLRGDTITAANKVKTACTRGHTYSAENTYIRPDGSRSCRSCLRDANRRFYARQRVARI